MAKTIDQGKMMTALDWGYDKAINGLPGMVSAEQLAHSYMAKGGSKDDQVRSLIRWQNTKAGTSGFLSGLGGVVTMPVSVPANISSVLYVQMRMVAAIATIGGYDVKDDRVQSLVYVCLAGNAAKSIMKDCGIALGSKLSARMIQSISAQTLIAINQKVGFRLVTKFGHTGVINLGKAVPLVGGVIGGGVDAASTHAIGRVARQTFIPDMSAALADPSAPPT
ncbi:EcsC family protein [Salinisphaera sp. SPP-AMP-43]|uniref:EcsC family protein n=1 Tax=Salinisphaera sp. SPP-AMP-43 TaxID=3121288 RepID=UPI003C6DFE36